MKTTLKKHTNYTVTLELDRCDLEVLIMALRFGLDSPALTLLPKVVVATVEEITKNLEELYTS